jgi:hypothetical protein
VRGHLRTLEEGLATPVILSAAKDLALLRPLRAKVQMELLRVLFTRSSEILDRAQDDREGLSLSAGA